MSIFQEIKKTVEQLKNKITGLQNLTDERLQELESLDKSIYKLQKDKPVISNNFPTT
jgi:chaperonin cofactor prefoldin